MEIALFSGLLFILAISYYLFKLIRQFYREKPIVELNLLDLIYADMALMMTIMTTWICITFSLRVSALEQTLIWAVEGSDAPLQLLVFITTWPGKEKGKSSPA